MLNGVCWLTLYLLVVEKQRWKKRPSCFSPNLLLLPPMLSAQAAHAALTGHQKHVEFFRLMNYWHVICEPGLERKNYQTSKKLEEHQWQPSQKQQKEDMRTANTEAAALSQCDLNFWKNMKINDFFVINYHNVKTWHTSSLSENDSVFSAASLHKV